MTYGPEYTLVEKPSIDILQHLGYEWLKPSKNEDARDGLNQVILKDTFIDAICRINGVDHETARSVYNELLSVTDNEQWTYILRGNYSRIVPGQSKKKTIHLIDFLNVSNNTFTVTNQLKVKSQNTRIPDLVCFVNGIPLVVIEAKSPVNFSNKMGEAFDQIKQYEKDIERLFYTNVFNIITDGQHLMYGTTGAASQYWGYWKDPWPKTNDDFQSELVKGYYCLLEPSRLLDLLAHFVVFEKGDNKVIKKICRYQQFRAVNKITDRILETRAKEERRGLIWHTQGSGKSLTMVFTTLKLKTHLNIDSNNLSSPNILVLTDRVDLDEQISGTFTDCGLPNPTPIERKSDLHKGIHAGTNGLTLLSTVFKFENSNKPVENSSNWILLVDECHRTQEKDLGAYLRKTFPEAWFFGFTGTPIKKTDKDTYANFSPPQESYLDKYSIDDAVKDGATVPIHYFSRKVDWHVDPKKIDILFDQWFAKLEDKKREKLKRKLTIGTLLKHKDRIETIAYDIWENFKTSAKLDGYKAQIVAYDREAIILYKRALNKVITKDLIQDGMSEKDAQLEAESYSVPVYSSNRDDGFDSEDEYIDAIRKDLVHYKLDDDKSGSDKTERKVKTAFNKKGNAPWFLIVCSKLLTGFDAPVESVMYLDNPLKEHNLLQAIARTNRIEGEHKYHGLIVDYVGVTKNLKEALNSYRNEDVQNAMHNLDDLRSELRQAHSNVINLMKTIKRRDVYQNKDDYTPEFDALLNAIGTEDQWLIFKRRAKIFIKLYQALTPDPAVLDYKRDLKWVSMFLMYPNKFEQRENVDLMNYSSKIREMLDKELTVTGLRDVVKIRSLTDEEFWNDFKTEGKSEGEIKRASVRKTTELKKTISEKVKKNPEQYESFSKRLQAIIDRLNKGQDDAAEILKDLEDLANDLTEEEQAHMKSGLTKTAHGIYKILEAYKAKKQKESAEKTEKKGGATESTLSKLQIVAAEIDDLYQSDETAPNGWHQKEQMKKELRGTVRRIVHPLSKDGLENWKDIPDKVEQYALKHYVVEQ
jgi:type I restriction enzyme, R subunit